MIITREWINAHKTPAGAWNRKQIEALGLEWPARKGWQKRVEGMDICEASRTRFERQADSKPQGYLTYSDLGEIIKRLHKEIAELKSQLYSN